MTTAVKHYGTTSEESRVEDILECRQIVKTIMDYGISQKQILKLIGLLALELESRDQLKQISDLVERFEKGDTSKSTLITEL